jgi:transposase
MIPAAVRIFLCTEAIDMRQGFDRLAQLVRSRLGEDP